MITEIRGDIFDSRAQAIVNPVSCEGAMTSRIGRECRKLFPGMCEKYQKLCKNGIMLPGEIFVYRSKVTTILNIGIKEKNGDALKQEMIEQCLMKFARGYKALELKSVAFPLLKPGEGNITTREAMGLMRKHLEALDLNVEIYISAQ